MNYFPTGADISTASRARLKDENFSSFYKYFFFGNWSENYKIKIVTRMSTEIYFIIENFYKIQTFSDVRGFLFFLYQTDFHSHICEKLKESGKSSLKIVTNTREWNFNPKRDFHCATIFQYSSLSENLNRNQNFPCMNQEKYFFLFCWLTLSKADSVKRKQAKESEREFLFSSIIFSTQICDDTRIYYKTKSAK